MSLSVIPPSAGGTPVVTLTDVALDKAREALAGRQDACLRLGVRGGGCSGYSYVLQIDSAQPTDRTWQQDGLPVACAADSVALLSGAVLDYHSSLQESGFKFENPNATGGCGCGSSFRVDAQQGCDAEIGPDDIYGAESAL